MEPFRVRLNCVDHYQATPSEFDPPLPYRDEASAKDDRPKVPVIRVFGATETGQKVCVHVHGAFPYLYIGYEGALDPEEGRLNLFYSVYDVANYTSEFCESEAPSFNRPRVGCELQSKCLRPKIGLRGSYHVGQRHSILWLPCGLSIFLQDLPAEPPLRHATGGSSAPRRGDEAPAAAVREPSAIRSAVDVRL